MIEQKFDSVFISLTGKSALLELKIKLLLDRDKNEVKGMSCSKVKDIIYNKYSEYFDEENKKIIDEAVWIRNKLVHFEFSEIFKKQKSIPSVVVTETVNPKDSNNILAAIKKISEGKSRSVNANSSLFGLCLEFVSNYGRIQELNDILDKAINIVKQVIIKSTEKIK